MSIHVGVICLYSIGIHQALQDQMEKLQNSAAVVEITIGYRSL